MKKNMVKHLVSVAVALGVCVTLSSCAKKATEEQLVQYHELKREIASLENSIKQNDTEKARINSELSSLQSQLGHCSDDLAFVKDKLSKWPDCWPDWHPAPPAPPPAPAEAPATKSGKKKH